MSGLSAPGSGEYSSNTLYVGDGTWDSQRNTFLLPNLQGLNFATTQYNGMGNRFRDMNGYKGLIMAHGILAAIAFLFVLPAAIFLARFYHRDGRLALRLHIWLQIGTVFLSTAVFVLGFQAVGLRRSLTNPHHGIGVALYTLILVQALGGSIIHKIEKGKERYKLPLKLMMHQWLGRLIAILGIVQVALGLTLWGSPKVLFILYAIWGAALIAAWFILSYLNQPEMGFDDRSTYITDTTFSSRRSHRGHGGRGALLGAGAAGAGLAAMRRRSHSRSRRTSGGRTTTVLSSSHPGTMPTDSYMTEKYTDVGHNKSTWRDRLLGAGAAAGGVFALKSLFGRKKKHPETTIGSDVSYSRPIGQSEVTQTDLTRLEEGRAPASPGDHWRRVEEREAAQAAAMGASPLRQGHRATRSVDSMSSFDSRTSISDERERPKESHGLRNGIAALGFVGFLKHQWGKNRNKKEDAHVEAMRHQDLEEERIARANSQRKRYTGDGLPPRRNNAPSTIFTESDISGTTPGPVRTDTNLPTTQTETSTRPAGAPVPPIADPQGVLSDSGSEAYISAGGRPRRRHHAAQASEALDAAAAGSPSKRDNSQRRASRDGSGVNSPPVSVKVKMHNDGRHVTLRRLNEEEAAAERQARRLKRDRDGSMSSLDNNERWRRAAAREAAEAQEMAQPSAPIPMPEPVIPPPVGSSAAQHSHLAPPPIPSSILSSPPGTHTGVETDIGSNYDTNRRRRRAERAQAKQARAGGSRVEFS